MDLAKALSAYSRTLTEHNSDVVEKIGEVEMAVNGSVKLDRDDDKDKVAGELDATSDADGGAQAASSDAGSQSDVDAGVSGSGDTAGTDTGSNSSGGRTFTQEDVTRMMTREKQQGRNSAFNELGIDPEDTKTIQLVKAIMAAQKQEEEPAVAPSSELIEAQHRADIAEAKAEAMMVGAQPKYVDDIVTLATAKLQNSDETDFKTVVSQIKEKYPVWFGASADDSSTGSKGTGSSIRTGTSAKATQSQQMSLGQRLAASRKASKPAKSFWNSK